MSATRRGAIIFFFIVLVSVSCGLLTFSILPNAGAASTLPVIVVPAEPYKEGWPSDSFYWTNTLTAMVLADLMIVAFVFLAWRVSKGWTNRVPGRFQSYVELLGNFIYDLCKSVGGKNGKMLMPIVASIFVFLLAVNWMKLLPGVESVGVMHCAGHSSPEIGISVTAGHPKLGARLWVDEALFTGYPADEDDYHACEEYKENKDAKPSGDALKAAAALLRSEEELLLSELDQEVEAGLITAEERDLQVEALRLEVVDTVYHHPSVAITADELEKGVVPYLFVVTPYVRGGSTDLNLPLGLALISFVAIQVYGYIALGPNYFQKFININALGNLNKRPLGAVDFLVGLFEIVSEFGKIISLSFRLFGNMFAGGILLAVMSFLVAFILPGVFIGLEVIITTIQAYVFAVLTLVFSAQAMEGHHGDDDHDHAAEH